jgi:hypothetical protein
VSKISKELKKATKFQPHYDHLYGKGRAKIYFKPSPPAHYGAKSSYGQKSYHVPHPVTYGYGYGGGEFQDDYGPQSSELFH